MERIDRTKHIRMLHAETDCAIAAHEVTSDATRVPVGKSSEVRVDVRHQFLDHEIFPVSGHRRIHVPRTSERSGHIDTYENELVDHPSLDRSIEEALRIPLVEWDAITFERGRKKVDNRITLRRSVV